MISFPTAYGRVRCSSAGQGSPVSWKLNMRKHHSQDDKAPYQIPHTLIEVPTSANRYQLETGVCPGSTVDRLTNCKMCQLHFIVFLPLAGSNASGDLAALEHTVLLR